MQDEEVKINDLEQKKLTIKKQNSYTYWVDPTKQNPDIQVKVPKKIDPPQVQQPTSGQVGPSAWNQSGTWEEKIISMDQVKKQITESFEVVKTDDNQVEFYKISKFDGHISIVTVRGKKKLGFNINMTYNFKGLDKCEGDEGTLEIDEFTEDGDKNFRIKSSDDKKQLNCYKQVENYIDILVSLVKSQIESNLN